MKKSDIRLFNLLCGILFLSFAFGCSGGGSASFTLLGRSKSLVSIEVTPTNPSIALGSTRQFTATGIYSDNTTRDLTASVTWTSSNGPIATISNAGSSKGLASSLSAGSTTITATSGTVFGNTTLTVTTATLISIQVAPTNPSIAIGSTRQFAATGIYSDNTSQDLTASVAWSSSSSAVATVSNTSGSKGLATSLSAGSTTITATSGTVSGNTTLTVTTATLISIQVTPTNPSIAIGSTRQFTATGIYSDNTTQNVTSSVAWGSSSSAVATVSNTSGSKGLATSLSAGSTTITATSGTVSGNTTLTVTTATLISIQVTPTNPGIALGSTGQFTATGIYSDNTTQDLTASVTWTSSSGPIATISNAGSSKGLASSLSAGSTTITATSGTVSGSTTLTVTAATLVFIQVTPTNPGIALGTTAQFTAIGIYSDNTSQNVTESVTWSSSDSTIATVSNIAGSNGFAASVDNGSITITATLGGISGNTDLTVTTATLDSIQVSPTNPSIALGTTRQFTATGIFSDSTTQDLTDSVTWSTPSAAVATVSNIAGSQGLATSVGNGSTIVTAALGGISGSTALTVTTATLDSIQVSPTNPSIALGTTGQFTATGIYSDNTTQDLTASVTWTSSNGTIATISNAGTNGFATSVSAGSTTVTATSGMISGSTTLTVTTATLVSIQVSPTNPSIELGTTRQFTASGIFSDSTSQDMTSSVTWNSSSTAVAAVSNTAGSNGLATSVSAGSTTITATSGTVSGSTKLTVTAATLISIEVSPTNPSIALGTTRQFSAIGIYSDGTNQELTDSVTWTSSSASVAAVNSSGLATSVAVGSVTITAASGTVSGNTTLTVTAATLISIQVSPTNPSIALGTTKQFAATGFYSDGTNQDLTGLVTWQSSNTTVAAVSSTAGSTGLTTSVAPGSAAITATLGAKSGSTTLTVTSATLSSIQISPANPGIALGTTAQFTATGIYSDGSNQELTDSVTWSTPTTLIAAVGNTGLATSIAAGSTTVTATLGAMSGSTTLTVTSASLSSIQVSPTNPSIAAGTTRQFTATGIYSDGTSQDLTGSVTWNSSDTAVAAVSNTAGFNGLASSIASGSATITATSGTKSGSTLLTMTLATLSSIQVSPTNPSIALGTTTQFSATGVYSDGTSQDLTDSVAWSTPTTLIAAVGNTGLATSIATGSTTVTATLGAKSGSTALTVTSATLSSIQLSPTMPINAAGTTRQFTATGIYSDGSSQDLTDSVTWTSSDYGLATIDSSGFATAVAAGQTTIAATRGTKSGSTILTVTSATLSSIQVSPTNPGIAAGTTRQFTATGIYSDGSSQDLTDSVTWTSSDSGFATINLNGLATSVTAGSATITATSGMKSGSTTLAVTPATLTSIQVSPIDPGIALGTSRQFTATGIYSDGSNQDLTGSVTWQSSDTAVAAVSNAAGINGFATSIAAGSITITATLGGKSGSTTLTVTSATLSSIQVSPTNPSIALGTTRQFTATGTYTDGTSQDLTDSVTWSSSSTSVAAINSNGFATSVAAGSPTITATFGGKSGSTTLTVTSATLSSIQISPTNPSIALGTSRQFAATGIYSDGSNQELTGSVTWQSSDTAVAAVSNIAGFNGFATSIVAGSITITATLGGKSGSTALTVTSATLSSIQVSPTNPSIALGSTRQFTSTGLYSDGTSQNLTGSVVWSSLDSGIATIDSSGFATSVAAGSTTVTATLGAKSGGTTLTVTSATLSSIQILPTNPGIALGTTKPFAATGFYSDGTSQELTDSVTWGSSSTSVATISSHGLATSVGAGSTTITATLGSKSDSTTLTVTSATLSSIQVSPTNPSIAAGTTRQFTATGLYSDGSNQNLTSSVTWNSSVPAFATIDANGLATSVGAGSTTISAIFGTKSGSTTLTVTSATLSSIQVSPTNLSIAAGMTRQFTATGIYSDSSSQDLTGSVTWSSSNTSFAAISNIAGSSGLATSVAAGWVTITATSGAKSGSTRLTVTSATLSSIQVSPTNPSIARGTTRQFTATGTYSDGTSQDLTESVTWSTPSTLVATISNTGLAASVAAGSTTVTATSGAKSGSTSLTVTPATLSSIQVSPTSPSIALGTTRQFTATGIYSDGTNQDLTGSVTWNSSDSGIATVASGGFATSVAPGSVIITAASGVVLGNTTLAVTSAILQSIQVSPTSPSIALGTTRQFSATGIYSDGTSQNLTGAVTWESSDTAVAAVNSNGLATSVAAGPATIITATLGAKSGNTTLTVTSATLSSIQISPTNTSVALGTTTQFTATGIYSDGTSQDLTASVAWDSLTASVAAVNANGFATSVVAGSTTITATLGIKSVSTTLTVTSATLNLLQVSPTSPSAAAGTETQFMATGIYSDGSSQDLTSSVTWNSSNTAFATIGNTSGNNGLATSLAPGSTVISAASGTTSGSTTLTVTAATLSEIQVSPTNPSMALGSTTQFTATGIYSDNTIQDVTLSVTWTSSSTSIATVSNMPGSVGLATSVFNGFTTITATMNGVSGNTTLNVTSATLQSIQVSPTNPSLALGTTMQFTATGIYSDNSSQDLTAAVTWNSSSPSAAAISNAPGFNGLATGVAAGSSTITATFSGISGSTTLTVTGATLQSIDVTQALPVMAAGTTNQFVATGTFSDSTTQDLTALVVWSSSDAAVAVISNAPGSQGLATSVGPGTATITAALGGVSGSTLLTVTSATLSSIQVSPTDPIVSFETTQQFTASGFYSDGSVQDITAISAWTSSDTAVATVSNAAGFNGLSTPVTGGTGTATTTISALFQSSTGATTLTVTPGVLTSVSISPSAPQIASGTTQQFTATGFFDSGSTQDVTAAVVWTSSNSTIVTVSNAVGANGLATSLGGAGTVTVTAALGSITNSTTLTVNPITISSIVVSNASGTTSIQLGSAVQFTAIATFTDSSTQDVTSQATWKSSNRSFATISNSGGSKGLLTPIAAGSVTVSATLTLNGTPYSGSQTITVVSGNPLQSITVTPNPASITVGSTQQFTAIGHYLDGSTQDLTKSTSLFWSSSNTQIASIKNNPTGNKGLATGKRTGTVTISATVSGVAPGTTTLTVN